MTAKTTETVKTQPQKKIPCKVLRDFWPKENQRIRKGAIVEVDPEAAMTGMEKGVLERVKKGK